MKGDVCLTVLSWFVLLLPNNGFCQRVDCRWGPYTAWTACGGCSRAQTRTRSVAVHALHGGNPCFGLNSETQPCQGTTSVAFLLRCWNPRLNCQWAPFGEWSECDGCTGTQTRSRAIAVYPQFRGVGCSGERTQSRACQTTKACPLEHGCGDRFRCRSGMCIPTSLMCNGDQDCEEDSDDERTCERKQHFVCSLQRPPPNIELLGEGMDLATGKTRGMVINTKSFGGQCRKIYNAYRLPQSLLKYTFVTKVQNDLNDEMYNSEWHYTKDIVKRETVKGTTSGYRNYDYHETDDRYRNFRLLVLKNDIELSSFQATSPQFLPISEEFWKALSQLPTVYNYAAYKQLLLRFGTHYLSEGVMGGSLRVIVRLNSNAQTHRIVETEKHDECTRTKRFILFFPITRETCDRGYKDLSRDPRVFNDTDFVGKVTPLGGSVSLITQLENMKIGEAEKNWELYTDWAASIKSFPRVIKSKLRPLWELVKEVHCAGVKKVFLRKATEQYLSESHPCNCVPCPWNGVAVMDNDACQCIPKPGPLPEDTSHMVVDGGWSCWASWSSCNQGQRKTRSRLCNNPAPSNGGQHCTGKGTETTDCDEDDLNYYRDFEPECFDVSSAPKPKCGPPPALINGYVLDPKDTYLVGDRVQYRCIAGFHLSGPSTFECTEAQSWSDSPQVCQLSNCMMPDLSAGVSVSPDNSSYEIGETVTLSCPEGEQLKGETTAICDPSLNFSPDPTLVTCQKAEVVVERPTTSTALCEEWEKEIRGKCVCKLPNECGPSLELCVSHPVLGHVLLSVCKVQALKCLQKEMTLAENSFCTWPGRSAESGCSKCRPWETCDPETSSCRCMDSAECASLGLSVCVRLGADPSPSQTLSECEVGVRRCRGDAVTVLDLQPCPV